MQLGGGGWSGYVVHLIKGLIDGLQNETYRYMLLFVWRIVEAFIIWKVPKKIQNK